MRLSAALVSVFTAFALTACLKPYRMDIQQGNVVTQAQLAELDPGMSRRDVRYVLGTPMVVDPFRENRWDYFFGYKSSRNAPEHQRRVTIVFDGDSLAGIEHSGEALAESEATAHIDDPVMQAATGWNQREIDRTVRQKRRQEARAARANERRMRREERTALRDGSRQEIAVPQIEQPIDDAPESLAEPESDSDQPAAAGAGVGTSVFNPEGT